MDVLSRFSKYVQFEYKWTFNFFNARSCVLGDPTVFGNLLPPEEVLDAVHGSLQSQSYNGYAPSTGKYWS